VNVTAPDFTESERELVADLLRDRYNRQGAVDGLIRELGLEQVFSFKPGTSFETPAP